MNQHRDNALTRSLPPIPSRRDVLRGLAGAGLGFGAARLPAIVAARKPRKKGKKARPNAFGCLDVGDRCRNASQCCSGICQGKNGKRRCKAHDAGGCEADTRPAICNVASGACTTSLGQPGRCATTTGKAGYCHDDLLCFACRTDADCPARTNAGPRAACIRCADCPETGGLACAVFDGSLG